MESANLNTANVGDVPAVDVSIVNNGTVPAEPFEVTVDWLDSNDEALDSDTERMLLLSAGETWRARFVADDEYASLIEDFNVFVPTVEPHPGTVNPKEITVLSKSLVTGEDVYVRAEIENERDTAIGLLFVRGKVYDTDNRLLACEGTQKDLKAGETWRLQLPVDTYRRDDQIEKARLTTVLL